MPLPKSAVLLPIVASIAIADSPPARADESPADGEISLGTLAALHQACRDAEAPGRRVLYSIAVQRFRFAGYDEDYSALPVDLRRNLKALRGAAEIFPSGREPIAFLGSAERATELATHQRAGTLRVGFFLNFDGTRRACLIRPSAGVTTVRADLAFVELIDSGGEVVAREDSDRLRAWLDDAEASRLPGTGPRAAVDAPMVERGTLPAVWRTRSQSRPFQAGVSRCYAEARSRGCAPGGHLYVSVRTDQGQSLSAQVMLSTVRDSALRECIAERFATLPAAPSPVHATFPIRFAD